jgi:hypothetical protein
MKNPRRRLILFLSSALVLVASSSLVLGAGNGPKSRPPRFSPPKDGRPGRINTVEYFLIDDPKEAAQTLLREAALAQVDINRPGPAVPHEEIEVPSGAFVPDRKDQAFFALASEMMESGRARADTVCLMKLVRVPSIKEMADIMALGVHVYTGIRYYTYIARVPYESAAALSRNPLVEWVGTFEASHKLPVTQEFTKGLPIKVYGLVRDEAACRRDLAGVGATVRTYYESIGNGWASYSYTVDVDPALIPRIAAFWWVERFGALPKRGVESASGEETSALLVGHLRPSDSRKLVSALNSELYKGDGVTVLVFDEGCYYQHPALSYRVVSVPLSDPSRDSFHGTHVSGILLGEHARFVKDGGVSGVAPEARFVLKENAGSLELALATGATDRFPDPGRAAVLRARRPPARARIPSTSNVVSAVT